MADDTFRSQIEEDISYYQQQHPLMDNADKPDWLFNLWVLDKLFGEDDDVIVGHIIDYHDAGVDCFVWHEETKDLYLIQNKYYDNSSQLTATYFNDTIDRAYKMLCEGNYKHCPELQQIFSANRQHPEFYVYHYFYVTNNKRSDALDIAVQKFNHKNADIRRRADVFFLDDIREAFYGEPIVDAKNFTSTIYTLYNTTILSINNEAWGLGFDIDARYVMLPVTALYKVLREADKAQYPIFDANIREYLGTGRSVNKGIINTLESPTERSRFFFYNNGITIICSSLVVGGQTKKGRPLHMTNPQIVNGCQTVSSIHQVLSAYPESDLADEFSDSFVMAKILIIPDDPDKKDFYDGLRRNIVKFNNSQNSIDEKNFAANEAFFRTVQREFEDKGFLVLLKQSDRETYSKRYKGKVEELRKRANAKIAQFGLQAKVKNLRDFMIPLDKLMQVILAFAGDAQQAFQKKGALLKKDSSQWKLVTEAIQGDGLTTQRMLDLYLLYLRSEYEKSQNSVNGRVPISWYLIEGFAKYECGGGDFSRISEVLSTSADVDRIIRVYIATTMSYLMWYESTHMGKGYNDMIKEKIDMVQFNMGRSMAMAQVQLM